MIIIDNKVSNYTYIKNTFDTKTIRKCKVVDYDDCGQEYNKTISYMPTKCLIDNALFNITKREPFYVGRVINYIINNLKYGTNVMTLKGTEIAAHENLYPADVSRGIARLEELEIIKPLREIEEYSKDNSIKKNVFTINHNYIFKGNINKLVKEFEAQRAEQNITE